MIEAFQSIEIPLLLTLPKEKHQFLHALVSNWLKAGTRLPGLKIEDVDFAGPAIFMEPDLNGEAIRVLGKRFMNLLKTLFRTVVPVSLDDLMEFMDFKSKRSFRDIYLVPLIQSELINKTIPDKPNDPNQQYSITKRGKLFLGGFGL